MTQKHVQLTDQHLDHWSPCHSSHFADSLMCCQLNVKMYIVQMGANSARSTVGAYICRKATHKLKILETWKIPITMSRYFEILIPNTEPTFKNTKKN